MDNINSCINVSFHYLSNKTYLGISAITVMDLLAKISSKNKKNWENVDNLYILELI